MAKPRKPRPVSYGYWREAASGRIHGNPRPACAVERELFPCRLTRPQWDGAVRCECAVWWGKDEAVTVAVGAEAAPCACPVCVEGDTAAPELPSVFAFGLVNVPLEASPGSGVWSFAVERSGELAVVWATYNTADGVLTVQAPDDGVCWVCGLGVRDEEGGEESVVCDDGVVWCASCARPSIPQLKISYGSTVVARVEGPAVAGLTGPALATFRKDVRARPFQVSDREIAEASRQSRHRRREGLPCPLCENAVSTCGCTARQLAVFASRQLPLPVALPVAPAMPAKPGSQGTLW